VALQRLKIARIADLNDPFELQAANVGGNASFKEMMRAWRNDLQKDKGLLCFSRHWYNPVLWSHYADKHRGICLGFALSDRLAIEVTYVRERIPAPVARDGNIALNTQYVDQLLTTKFEHWAYESEVRVFLQLDHTTAEHGLFFYEFSRELSLEEVILGPLCELSLESVRRLVARTKPDVHVLRARLADKFFNVVPDEETLQRDYVNPLDGSRRHPRHR
jgi:hypothetical protein